MQDDTGLERKFCRFDKDLTVSGEAGIAGYASLFGIPDQGGDVVAAGAYGASLKRLAGDGRRVKMLWQHDPAQPIGIWDEVREDARGLYVNGRILDSVEKGREAAALIAAGPSRGCRSAIARCARRGTMTGVAAEGTGALGGVAGDLPDAAQCAGGGQGRWAGRR